MNPVKYRTHHNGQLRLNDKGKSVALCGWVQRARNLGGLTFVDLRDRYGITQLAFNMDADRELCEEARKLGREFVIAVTGLVVERESKNAGIKTGEIEIRVDSLKVLNAAKTPPFTIEDGSDGGDELRMKYRYLDLRRGPLQNNIALRHRIGIETRKYMNDQGFFEIETPYLIKSTPEGARDFVVPSRMNQGQFYALPQSPQTFKQLLMVSGYDRYFQIVRCFRDEDLRADRQPEFTQIDCEMAFVEREDILNTFEGLVRHLFQSVKGIVLGEVPRMTYHDAMRLYGCDKPDTRFAMIFHELNDLAKGKGFNVFDSADLVVGFVAEGCSEYTRKQLDELTEFVKKPQIGAKGLVYIKWGADDSIKSSVDKFYTADDLKLWMQRAGGKAGDLMLVLSGDEDKTRKQLNELRLRMGSELGLRNPDIYNVLWVVDFPLVEYDEESGRWHAMHHPFTSPRPEDLHKMETDPGSVNANAYDMVINGVEVGGGSIRIHDRKIQESMFRLLGFSDEEARAKFGFLMDAFEFGAPPHGGIAFGFDRLCSLFGGQESIRDFIAFPKNNSGRDTMIDAPSVIDAIQLEELGIHITSGKN
jgi:aspartyl-tRNA synthetase